MRRFALEAAAWCTRSAIALDIELAPGLAERDIFCGSRLLCRAANGEAGPGRERRGGLLGAAFVQLVGLVRHMRLSASSGVGEVAFALTLAARQPVHHQPHPQGLPAIPKGAAELCQEARDVRPYMAPRDRRPMCSRFLGCLHAAARAPTVKRSMGALAATRDGWDPDPAGDRGQQTFER